MITSIENEFGIISFDNALMDQIITDSLSGYKACFRLVKKEYSMEAEGVAVDLHVVLKFGTSISSFSNDVLGFIYNKLMNNLELTVKHIRLHIVGIYSKKLVKRDIIINYDDKLGITDNRN